MAYDYLIDKAKEDAERKSLADHIRAKGGTTAKLDWPTGFEAAVDAIPSGGGEEVLNSVIDKSITEIKSNAAMVGGSVFKFCKKLTNVSFPVASEIGYEAFSDCYTLTTVSFPAARSIGGKAFYCCYDLTTASFPVASSIGGGAFGECVDLATVSFPEARSIGDNAFGDCITLTTVSFPVASEIGNRVFFGCTALTAVSFPVASSIRGGDPFSLCDKLLEIRLERSSSVCTLSGSLGRGLNPNLKIYVPESLIEQYKVATNWSNYATQFVAIPGV